MIDMRRRFTITTPYFSDWNTAPQEFRDVPLYSARCTCEPHCHDYEIWMRDEVTTDGAARTVSWDGPYECDVGRKIEHALMRLNMVTA